ncbi:MAG: hypothetical protein CSB47_00620 [Proteobacteria bacterium]|nr:MAG: hypothetical protein CSB47_00620 [Pseudomonadota bacterium]
MPSQLKPITLLLAVTCLYPATTLAEGTFSYDFYEVGVSSTTDGDNSYTSLDAAGSMEINNKHFLTATIKSDISSDVTANEVGVGIGAYKSSSEETDYYSRAGIKHGKRDTGSQQTLNIGFGARHQLSDAVELQGGIDALFSTHEDSSGISGSLSALYKFDETIQLGGQITTDGDLAETRLFTRVKML